MYISTSICFVCFRWFSNGYFFYYFKVYFIIFFIINFNIFDQAFTTHGSRPHAALKAHPCSPSSSFQNFLFLFSCWLWRRSTIKTANEIHWSSMLRSFEVQISCLAHPRLLLVLSPSIWMILRLYYSYPANNVHISHNISLWRVVIESEAC